MGKKSFTQEQIVYALRQDARSRLNSAFVRVLVRKVCVYVCGWDVRSLNVPDRTQQELAVRTVTFCSARSKRGHVSQTMERIIREP